MVIQEAAAEVARQEASSNHTPEDTENIYAMLNDSETEAGLEAKTRAHSQARPNNVESSDSELQKGSKAKHDFSAPKATPTKKITRSQTS